MSGNACAFGPIGIPLEDFQKLAKLKKIQFVWGDNRPRYTYVQQSRLCAKLINDIGGNAEVLKLGDDAGLKGSTHIPFADMDNDKVADLLDVLLKTNGLDQNKELSEEQTIAGASPSSRMGTLSADLNERAR